MEGGGVRPVRRVVLYYPNEWRRYIGDLAPDSDKSFSWFLCSKRYIDPKYGHYVAEVGFLTKFYDPSDGHSLVVPVSERKPLMLIAKGGDNDLSAEWEIVRASNYQGIAVVKPQAKTSTEDVLCGEVLFYFLDGVLELSKREETCAIITYAKRNYGVIRQVMPDFPSPTEIDEALRLYKCSTVCKILYGEVVKYLSKLQD